MENKTLVIKKGNSKNLILSVLEEDNNVILVKKDDLSIENNKKMIVIETISLEIFDKLRETEEAKSSFEKVLEFFKK